MTDAAAHDDLSRAVYCILGVPIDAIDITSTLHRIERAAGVCDPYLISTPNLNFLVTSQDDPEFRESLLQSDLCPPDGEPIIWIARLLGLPIKRRVAGADIFETLQNRRPAKPLKIFLFGGTEPIAKEAARRINSKELGVTCVGWLCPGFGGLHSLSKESFFDRINASGADFIVAALGARNGQIWFLRNHDRLHIPIRAHLGAVLNFAAGSIKRAPIVFRKCGIEWMWRIKEEPSLFRRYWRDGFAFLRLLAVRILPLAVRLRWLRLSAHQEKRHFDIVTCQRGDQFTVTLSGFAIADRAAEAAETLREATMASSRLVIVDMSQVKAVDARFFGLFLMLRKELRSKECSLEFQGVSSKLRAWFRLNSVEYLLSSGTAECQLQ